MRTFSQNEPLTDAELDRLDDFLYRVNPGDSMSLEELDGYFCALIDGNWRGLTTTTINRRTSQC